MAYARQKAILTTMLESASWVCTTADAWTSRRRSFVGVTVHWLTPDLVRKSGCLAVRRVIGTANYEVLAKLLESVNAEFGIINKLTATITDNGSNFVKAFRVFGTKPEEDVFSDLEDDFILPNDPLSDVPSLTTQNTASPVRYSRIPNQMDSNPVIPTSSKSRSTSSRFVNTITGTPSSVNDCSINNLLDEIESDFEESESDVSEEEEELDLERDSVTPTGMANRTKTPDPTPSVSVQVERLQAFSSDENDIDFIPITETLNDKRSTRLLYSLPKHRRCACHTLNLVAKQDAMKQLDDQLMHLMNDTEKKLLSLWSKQNKSSKASDTIQAKLDGLFVVHNATRWNSYFDALERVKTFLLTRREDLIEVFKHFKIDFLRPAEELFITEYCKIMKPLADALDILQGDKNVCIGYLLPTLAVLKTKMNNLKMRPENVLCGDLIKAIIAGIEKRFDELFEDEELIIAAILHPKFKTSWITEKDVSAKVKILQTAYDCFKAKISEPAR